MKRKNIYLALLASVTFAGCSNDAFMGVTEIPETSSDAKPVLFSSVTNSVTRAGDLTKGDAAAKLGNKFVVFGAKSDGTNLQTIFDNYLVTYKAGTAGSTSSNTDDWEYVGNTSLKGASQSLKTWDFSAKKYDFVAVSGLADGEMIKNTEDGFRIKVENVEKLTSIYVSDRVTAKPTAEAATPTTPAAISYGSTVQLPFRRLGAQMRIGFYEAIPGYAVKNLVFYYIGASSGSYTVGAGGAYPSSGMYTVAYDTDNEAQASFIGASNKMQFMNTFGKLDYTSARSAEGVAGKVYLSANGESVADPENVFIGTSSSTATFAKGTYTIDGEAGQLSDFRPILPNQNNTLKMQLRLDYTLVSIDGTGEEIHVKDAYVEVPVKFCQWQPNHSYTYIFKISDQSNGYTGEGGGGEDDPDTPGRKPDPDNGGGDTDPVIDPETGEVIPPYIPDPSYPTIPDPDAPQVPNPDYDPTLPEGPGNEPTIPDPTYPEIPDPDAPLIPNPDYPTGPEGNQGDPSNPVPTPVIPNPDYDPTDPDSPEYIPDPTNPTKLYPITFDTIVVDVIEKADTYEKEIK